MGFLKKFKVRRKRFTIQKQMIATLGTIILLLSAVLSIFSYINARNAVDKTDEMLLPQIAVQTARLYDEYLKQGYHFVEQMARLDELSHIRSLTASSEDFNIVEERLQRYFTEYKVNGWGIIDATGMIFMGPHKGVDISFRDYFKQAIQGITNTSDIIQSVNENKQIIVFAAPIKNDGKTVGVVFMENPVDYLHEFAHNIHVGQTGGAFFVSSDGTITAHINTEYVTNELNPINAVQKDERFESFSEIIKHMKAGEIGYGAYNLDGVSRYVGYAPVQSTAVRWGFIWKIKRS